MKEQNFDSAYEKVKELVIKFQQGEKHYLSQFYQEAEVRQDFLDNFFTALGWDVTHKEQKNPYEQEVKIEKGVRVSGAQKRADYSFAIAPNFRDPLFFVEAKKPAKALRNAQDYFQSIRYGWHKAHPLSILTDFEEFHILDCRYTPDINNSLDKCYKRYHYTDYLDKEKFAEIYFLFSREAVANNSIENISDTLPKRKGKATTKTLFPYEIHQTIDEAFLEEIDGIREKLAKAFKKQDENLTSEELTEATQRTIDRLVFIRFLEDKLIEQKHYVSEFGEKGTAWNDFISACRKLNAKYNGIVFKEHFIDKQTFAGPEVNEFRIICQDLCHLNSQFLFNEIPIHILGSIYERFLGKVVNATAKRVTVDEKPEVKKAGGVYYTPKYIVDYIVRNSVGKLIEGKTSEEIAEMRFADIACGSGSFLISVFDCLLIYYQKYYQKYKAKAITDGCIEKDGQMVLSIKQKQKILLNNIYGVDIDQQATEVTQLSLALKLLEDETTATANDMQVLFHEKILPDMSKNIFCGNSLIGTDILTFNGLFSGDEEKKLNPMNFKDVFKNVMKVGGFDVIIGNPPYVNIENLEEDVKKYFFAKYKACKGRADIYIAFIEKALSCIKQNGLISFIIPYAFTNQNYGALLRASLIKDYFIKEIVDTSNYFVFDTANVKNIILTIQNSKTIKDKTIIKVVNCSEEFNTLNLYKTFSILQNTFIALKDFRFETKPFSNFLSIKNNICKKTIPLKNICLVAYGARINHKTKDIGKDHYISFEQKKGLVPFCEGKNIDRYNFEQYGWLQYTPTEHYNSMFPELFESEKLMFINVVKDRLRFAYDNLGFYNSHTVINCVRLDKLIKSTHPSAKKALRENNLEFCKNYHYFYLLAILNSNLINWYFITFLSERLHFYPNDAKNLPIKEINFKNKTEKGQHDKIISLVEKLFEVKREIMISKTEKDKTYSERKYSSIDSAIDEEIYKLYNLSIDEIKII